MCNNGRSLVCIWHIAAPDVYDGTSKSMAKADTAFQGASVGQPTEPCLEILQKIKIGESHRYIPKLNISFAPVTIWGR